MEFNDLVFAMTDTTSNGRYEVFIKPQDDSCTDYLSEPFEMATDDLAYAESVRGLIVANREHAIDMCLDAMGLTRGDYDFEGIWFQLFLIDTTLDYSDTDSYYESYEVL